MISHFIPSYVCLDVDGLFNLLFSCLCIVFMTLRCKINVSKSKSKVVENYTAEHKSSGLGGRKLDAILDHSPPLGKESKGILHNSSASGQPVVEYFLVPAQDSSIRSCWPWVGSATKASGQRHHLPTTK